MRGANPLTRREPLRICSILTSLTSGGAETLVANLSQEYSAAGHDSVVLTLCDAAALGNPADAEHRLSRQIRDSGGAVVSLGLDASRGTWSGGRAMRDKLRELAPDVIHAHTARALPMLAMRSGSAPVVLTHHNTRLSFPPVMFRLFDRLACRYVAISRETEQILAGHVRRPVTFIPNAAGAGFTGSPRGRPNSPLRLLSAGTVSEQKNYSLVLEAMRVLRDEALLSPLPVVRIAGDGAGLEALRARAAELRLDANVQFLGSRSDVAALMQNSDAYLNTSLYEGMPIAVLEAMRMALPIVATDVPGNRELVASEGNGLLAPLEVAAVARTIARLASDPALYVKLSAGSLEASGQFSMARTAEGHLALYSEVLGKAGFLRAAA